MRALNVYRLLSLAVVLLECESSGAGEPKQKSANKDDRKLQYGYGYSYGYDYPETGDPTPRPTFKPTPYPTPRPTPVPTHKPSPMPTPYPSPRPTPHPTHKPTMMPTNLPTPAPVPKPTKLPTPNPTPDPTPRPTLHPTPQPTEPPSCEPSPSPSGRPTPLPTPFPTPVPTPRPTPLPTPVPTPLPTPVPTEKPTPFPTRRPTPDPTRRPSEEPTQSEEPSEVPTGSEEPSENPTFSSSFSSSLGGSYTSTCVGETLLDIICADRNQAIFEAFCTALRQTGLDALLDDCRNQLTVFAPNRFAFNGIDGDDDDDDDDCNPSNIGGPAQNCNFVNNIPQPFIRQQTCNFLNCQPNTGCCGNGDGDDDDDDDDDECNPNNNGGPAVNCNFVNNIPQQFRQQTCNFLNCQPNTGCCTNRRLAEDPIREDGMLSTFVAEDNADEAPRALQSGQCPPNAQSFLNGNTFDYVAFNRAISGCYGPNGFCPPNAQNYFSGTNFNNVGYQQAINECYGGGNGIPGFVPTIPGNVVINPFNPIIPSGNNAVLARLLAYHITNGVYRERDLSCSGRDQSIRMLESGFSETRCNGGAPVIQTGTCNVPGNFPQLIQTNIVAANGIIHVVNNLLIPSPDGTPAGCVGGPFVPTTPTRRPTSAPANSCNTGNVGGPPINCNFLLYLPENQRQCNLYNCQQNTGGTCCGQNSCVAAREDPTNNCPPDPACYYDADNNSFANTDYEGDLLSCTQQGGFVVPPGGFLGPPIVCSNVAVEACPYLNCLEGTNPTSDTSDPPECRPRGTDAND